MKKTLRFGLMFFAIMCTFVLNAQVSGIVYKDYDANGHKTGVLVSEPFVSGITVKAYSTSDVLLDTKITDAAGAYSFTGLTLPIRIEFSGLPASYLHGVATDSFAITGSSVQFHTIATTKADFRINNPDNYSQLRPMVLIPNNYIGLASANTSDGTLNGIYYNTTNITNPTDSRVREFFSIVTPSITGANYGLAYSRRFKKVYLASVVRHYFGNKIDGTNDSGFDDIYTLTFDDANDTLAPVANLTLGSTIDLSSLGVPVGVDPRNTPMTVASGIINDHTTYQRVGKSGIGDLEVSTDGDTLFAMNLNDAAPSIAIINITGTPTLISNVAINLTPCTNGTFRPWALKYYEGKLYVGGVCDASSGGTAADLQAYVYRYDGGTTFTQIATMPLNYTRGKTTFRDVPSNTSAAWLPWTDTWAPQTLTLSPANLASQPQPMLMDIEFTEDGSMILGFGDRFTYQAGHGQRAYDVTSGTSYFSTPAGGDIIKFCNIGGTLVQEATTGGCLQVNYDNGSASVSGGNTNPTPAHIAAAVKEFFDDDYYNSASNSNGQAGHSETSLGSLALLPGRNQLLATAFDPISTELPGGTSGDANTSGVRFYNSITGNQVLNTTTTTGHRGWVNFTDANTGSNRKGGNMGDIEILSDAAPIEIGNRLWNDANANGIQDAGEGVFPNVSVELYLDANNDCIPDGAALATVITNANGEYIFSNQITTEYAAANSGAKFNIAALVSKQNYIVRIAAADWNSTTGEGAADLANFHLTTSNVVGNGISDWSDNDASIVTITGSRFAQICLTTGTLGENNHTYDFGFKNTISLCGVVWNDVNENAPTVGAPDGTEQVINGTNTGGGVTTSNVLYANLLDASNNVLATTPIAIDGSYCFPIVPQKTVGITVQLTTNQGTVGQPKPATNIPTGWVTTGENKNTQGGIADATPNSEIPVTTDIINITTQNFGLQQVPESAVRTEVLGLNPGGTVCSLITASWFETSNVGVNPNTQDYNGGTVTNIRITSFPTNATSITVNGTTYLSTDPVWALATPGILIPYTSGTGTTQTICLDPIDGLVSSVIPFVSIDNAGRPDPTPGSVTVNYTSTLPVTMLSFTATNALNAVNLNWIVAIQQNVAKYEIQKSANGIDFTIIGITTVNNTNQYLFNDNSPFAGNNYYRIKAIDNDGSFKLSNILKINRAKQQLQVYPTIANNAITIMGIKSNATIQIISTQGKLMETIKSNANAITFSTAKLSKGTYFIKQITNGIVETVKFIKE